jgi:hypothetical protein
MDVRRFLKYGLYVCVCAWMHLRVCIMGAVDTGLNRCARVSVSLPHPHPVCTSSPYSFLAHVQVFDDHSLIASSSSLLHLFSLRMCRCLMITLSL